MQRFASTTINQVNVDVVRPSALAATSKSGRYFSLDLMRGLIMVIMAWDHTKDINASPNWQPKHAGSESWDGPYAG